MTTDKKRAQTSYGSVEYDTLQCVECTNETVTSEITHLYSVGVHPVDEVIEPESITVQPVCHGCITETYGGSDDIDILDHETLCRFYAKQGSTSRGIGLLASSPETTETSAATMHGTVDVSVAFCSRCGGEWVVDDLRCAHVPIEIVGEELHAGTRCYCPDCRELYVAAVGSDGPTFQEVVETEGDVLSDVEESVEREDTDVTPLKQAIILFIGGALMSIIGAAIHPAVGGLLFLATCAMAGYTLYRHLRGLGPIPTE